MTDWTPFTRTLASSSLGVLAALLIGSVGHWHNRTVFVLALAGGLSFSMLLSSALAQRSLVALRPRDRFGPLMQIAFLAILVGAAWDNRAREWDYPGVVESVGLGTIAAGVLLRRSASAKLGALFTVRLSIREKHELVSTGPYRWVRHPNYGGLALIAIGTSLAVLSATSMVLTLFAWVPSMLLRIREEEEALHRVMGPAYSEYVRRSWRLIPRVY